MIISHVLCIAILIVPLVLWWFTRRWHAQSPEWKSYVTDPKGFYHNLENPNFVRKLKDKK